MVYHLVKVYGNYNCFCPFKKCVYALIFLELIFIYNHFKKSLGFANIIYT